MPNWFVAGALAAGVGVGMGAFGAHALRDRIAPDLLTVFETGVRYQMYHALALLALGWASTRWTSPWIGVSGWLFLAGILLFSGSLFLLALTGARAWGAVTPWGGLAFIAAWACLALGVLRSR